MILDIGMAFAVLFAGTAKRYTLVQCNIVADHRGLTNDDTHAVVDEYPMPKCGSGMYLDAGKKAGDLAHESRETASTMAPKPVLTTMRTDRLHAGIADKDGECRRSGRVALLDRLYIFT
jgi:hypothetical protein